MTKTKTITRPVVASSPANALQTLDLGPDGAAAAYIAQFSGQPPIQPLSPEDVARTGQLTNEPSYVTAGTEPPAGSRNCWTLLD
jgi:hypothetical protein